jgi:DNA-nicking Smr family endonuclease
MAGGLKCNLRTQGTVPTKGLGVTDWSVRAPDATFDLHGQTVLEAVTNAERFLRAQARARRGGVVRLITGRGRAGGGAPIRTRVRTLLRRLQTADEVVRDFLLEESEGSYLVRLAG